MQGNSRFERIIMAFVKTVFWIKSKIVRNLDDCENTGMYIQPNGEIRLIEWLKRALPNGRMPIMNLGIVRCTSRFSELISTALCVQKKCLQDALRDWLQRRDTVSKISQVVVNAGIRDALNSCMQMQKSKIEDIEYKDKVTYAVSLLSDATASSVSRFKQEILATFTEETRESLFGGFATQVKTQFRKRIPNIDLSSSTEVFPYGTRYYERTQNVKIVIVEQQPQVRTVEFARNFVAQDMGTEYPKKTRFHLAFPYLLFCIVASNRNQLQELWLYYRTHAISSLEDEVYLPNLPNICTNGHVCLGFRGADAHGSLIQLTDEVITHFWQSEFNMDLSDPYFQQKGKDRRLRNLEAWEHASKEDSMFLSGISWHRIGTVQSVIREIMSRFNESDMLDIANQVLDAQIESLGIGMEEFIKNFPVESQSAKIATRSFVEHLGLAQKQAIWEIHEALQDIPKEFTDTLISGITRHFNHELDVLVRESIEQAFGEALNLEDFNLVFSHAKEADHV